MPGLRGFTTMLRLPRALGPHSIRPWNQPGPEVRQLCFGGVARPAHRCLFQVQAFWREDLRRAFLSSVRRPFRSFPYCFSRRISRGSLSFLNPADVSVSYGRKRERKLERNKKNQPAKGWLLSCPSVSLFVPLNTKIMDRGSDVLFFSLLSVIVAELYN
jgi:hypothetical protein